MEATIARALQVLIALSGAYLAALWVVLAVWTYRDIEARSRSVVTQVLSTMLTALFFVPGVLLYMILRPKETLDLTFQRTLEEEYLLQDLEANVACPNCNRAISDEFIVCPHCHAQLQEACARCGRDIDVRWSVCPYCAHEKGAPLADCQGNRATRGSGILSRGRNGAAGGNCLNQRAGLRSSQDQGNAPGARSKRSL
jgi:RNA polymerase subunit RPABC4/transcription elongation factor Spt4